MSGALINQEVKSKVRSLYVRHATAGYRVIDSTELVDYLAAGYHEMINPSWRYHLTAGSDIFGEDEFDELKKNGWVDSPAKLLPIVEPVSAVPSIDNEMMVRADTEAHKMLGSPGGLSQAALMRKFGMNPKQTTQITRFKPVYKAIFAKYASKIKKQGVSWYWKSKDVFSDGVDPDIKDDNVSTNELLKDVSLTKRLNEE